MSARVKHEHRFEVLIVDRGPLKTRNNSVRFQGSDPKEFVRVVQPVIEKMFGTWVKQAKKDAAGA